MRNKTFYSLVVVVLLISVVAAHKTKGKRKQNNKKECKYKPDDVSKCDESGIQRITLKSKNGLCSNKVIQRQCKEGQIWKQKKKQDRKLGCKYSKGTWGLCNSTNNLRPFVATLVNVSQTENGCQLERVRGKPCKFACRYTHSEWSECDKDTNLRSKQLSLIDGSPSDCPTSDTKTKKCVTAKGKEKCFYSKWSDFGQCVKGRMMKSRKLLAGGAKCKRRTKKFKRCNNNIAEA